MRFINKSKWDKIQTLQKGTHFMSKIHKPFEDLIVYMLYDFDFISADHISIFTYALAFLTSYMFLTSNIVLAVILAFIVGILDGVDGKIARLRNRKTYIGKLEHSFDMLYEQSWYITFTWYSWLTTNNLLFLIMGLIWLIIDSYVRHIYHIVWIATGRSLKYHGKLCYYITLIDGRRSVYVLHIIIWLLLSIPWNALYTILIHCSATAIAYTIISIKIFRSSIYVGL